MIDYKNITDEKLWELTTAGDADAERILFERFMLIIRIYARTLFLSGGDRDDLYQEGMLGLLSAVRSYDPDKAASFRSYAELCIHNRMISAVKTASRNKHTPLNSSVSFESSHFDQSNTVAAAYLRDPEELIITRERVSEIFNDMRLSLSDFETRVFYLYIDGLSYAEIAEILDKTPKSIDNAVQRIRNKLKREH